MDVKFFDNNIKFKFRVSGIVFDNNKILVEQYKDDTYCLPGGYVEFNENTEDAIVRELYEETKTKFKVDKFMGVVENFFINKKGENTHEIDFYYYLKGINSIKKINGEIVEKGSYNDIHHHFKWIDINELSNYKLLPNEIQDAIINKSVNIHLIVKK